jgi:hypothetical protein
MDAVWQPAELAGVAPRCDEGGNAMPNQPVQEICLGSIRASIWENATENGSHFNIVFTKRYKTGGQWQTTGSFSRDDLPLVGKLAELAHDWICQQKQRLLQPGLIGSPETENDDGYN